MAFSKNSSTVSSIPHDSSHFETHPIRQWGLWFLPLNLGGLVILGKVTLCDFGGQVIKGNAALPRGPGPIPQLSFQLTAEPPGQIWEQAVSQWIPQLPVNTPQVRLCWAERAVAPESHPNCKLMKMNDCCFKPLHFGVVCYMVIVVRTLLTLQRQKGYKL